ncbi:hypothetical protein BS47DRAFT_745908 [Hydnum rufescens UP504]|uniref:Uncharacterized protein n=1 Tax=Hydnum rufescens UP504 TaxID=1448309 RepID=A0A9P6ADX6_9AGAM|nr:hypothetical protein BS47DRAFT_745908 [Hydnum rufescens UP504]
MREDTVSRSYCFSSSTQEGAHDPCPPRIEFTLRTLKILHVLYPISRLRNTLEIVCPQSLTPSSLSDHTGYGGVSSVNRQEIVDTRHALRSHGRGQPSLVRPHASTSQMTIRLPNYSVCCSMLLGDVVPYWHPNSCWHPRRGEEVRCCQCFSPDRRLMKAGE